MKLNAAEDHAKAHSKEKQAVSIVAPTLGCQGCGYIHSETSNPVSSHAIPLQTQLLLKRGSIRLEGKDEAVLADAS